jgi:hypothetical protein
VVHVSQQKRHVPPRTLVESDLDSVPVDPQAVLTPLALLDSRMIQKGASSVAQVQVHWSSLPASMTTWEEVQDLRHRFPTSPTWGQVVCQEEGPLAYCS